MMVVDMPPIYDFKCPKCNNITEIIMKHDAPNPPCPKCGVTMSKLLSASGQDFRLYGEGFHKRTHKDTGDYS